MTIGTDALSRREREVAGLVARGESNREIDFNVPFAADDIIFAAHVQT